MVRLKKKKKMKKKRREGMEEFDLAARSHSASRFSSVPMNSPVAPPKALFTCLSLFFPFYLFFSSSFSSALCYWITILCVLLCTRHRLLLFLLIFSPYHDGFFCFIVFRRFGGRWTLQRQQQKKPCRSTTTTTNEIVRQSRPAWNIFGYLSCSTKSRLKDLFLIFFFFSFADDSMAKAPLEDPLEDATSAAMASQAGDLGYMHKKFKKVAPTFLEQPSEMPPVAASLPPPPPPPPADDQQQQQQPAKSKEEESKPGAATKGGRYVCNYCQHACAKPSVLEKHIRAHTNERPYPCVPCGFAFKTKSNLYKHCKSRTHVLKLEETGAASGPPVDPPEVGSDDNTSDDNVNDQVLNEDSDDGEQIALVPPAAPAPNADALVPSSPEKFKTPYKPKFHNFKQADEAQIDPAELPLPPPPPPPPPASAESVAAPPGSRPSPGFLQERISQIISKNQAIVETKDPLWPRRYIRQSSRDKEAVTVPKGANSGVRTDILPPSSKKNLSRDRSYSFNDPSSSAEAQLPIPNISVHPALRAVQEADESQRKRCHSEGPVGLLSHSVTNLLHQPSQSKHPRMEAPGVVNSQNTEGSIIKDILLKSRGLLTPNATDKDVGDPPRMSSSFSVRALLNPSTSTRSRPSESTTSLVPSSSGGDETDDRPAKKSKTSPEPPVFLRPMDGPAPPPSSAVQVSAVGYANREDAHQRNLLRASLPPFGGQVEIHDGHQRTVMRIEPSTGFGGDGSSNRLNGLSHADVSTHVTSSVVVAKSNNFNSGGGIVHVQPHESRVSVFPVKHFTAGGGLLSDRSSSMTTDTISRSSIHRSASPPPTLSGLPYIPGIPGPYSSAGWSLPTSNTLTYTSSSSSGGSVTCSKSSSFSPIPLIAVHPPAPSTGAEERTDSGFGEEGADASNAACSTSSAKFLRPSSLSLQPGTFNLKKANMAGVDPTSGLPNMLCVSGPGGTLISPETPRPRKLIRQLYLNGHAYTYLGLKCSTRVYFCCLSRAQPMYVLQQCHPKLSMYSQWKTRAPASELEASSPVQAMALYDSRQRPCLTSTAQSADSARMILTHSSYWTNRDRPTTAHLKLEVVDEPAAAPPMVIDAQDSRQEVRPVVSPPLAEPPATTTAAAAAAQPKRVRIFAGGYKSTEEYTYVRGRGRGRYVCEECGIRCKKPSMLKKHIRTHTDLRPYTCRQCNFSFKTKGNLTKHMKSKAHHKKCTELGIVPVPTSVDDANIDEDSLARQESLKKMKLAGGGSGNEGDSDLDDDDDDDDDDDEDEEAEGEEEEDEADEDNNPTASSLGPSPTAVPVRLVKSGQFEDAAGEERIPVRGEREQEVARSLLDLGVMAPAGSKPTTYPYASHFHPADAAAAAAQPPVTLQQKQQQPVVEVPHLKEEQRPLSSASSPPLAGNKAQQPMDLTTLRSSPGGPHSAAGLVASVYSQKVANEAALRKRSSPSPTESDALGQPATSGMLQAYLTERALKDGLIKRHQVKLVPTTAALGENKASPVMVLATSSQLADRDNQPSGSRVHLVPTDPASKMRPEFVVPLSSSSLIASSSAAAQTAYRLTDDGKTACSICNKVFTKPSQLRLHINIHYFERPFRCEACAVSFRTKGHLQKHKRSVTHFNKVNMNLTFGTPSTENPRPFKCSDCMIAFRIHGHLAKHLRSKMHIMKLECLGKLPFGTYAEMERSGVNLNEIDTTDCHNSLESLQSLAHRLYKQDPAKIQQWQQEVI